MTKIRGIWTLTQAIPIRLTAKTGDKKHAAGYDLKVAASTVIAPGELSSANWGQGSYATGDRPSSFIFCYDDSTSGLHI